MEFIHPKGPTNKLQPGEEVKFIIEDEEIKHLYYIRGEFAKRLGDAAKKVSDIYRECRRLNQPWKDNEIFTETQNELFQLAALCDALNTLFWDSISFDHPEITFESFAIRENWQVVLTPAPSNPMGMRVSDFSEVLKELLEIYQSGKTVKKPTTH